MRHDKAIIGHQHGAAAGSKKPAMSTWVMSGLRLWLSRGCHFHSRKSPNLISNYFGLWPVPLQSVA